MDPYVLVVFFLAFGVAKSSTNTQKHSIKSQISRHFTKYTPLQNKASTFSDIKQTRAARSNIEGNLYSGHSQRKHRRSYGKDAEVPHIEFSSQKMPEEVVGEKKSIIHSHIELEAGNPDEESGSGSGDEVEQQNQEDETAEMIEEKLAERRRLQCHRKCSLPMSFEECAIPRCGFKVGTIKDLCYYLCKHQKPRCEDICDD